MSRRGICHIWFRGRHISPSMPYREARSVAESSEGPTAIDYVFSRYSMFIWYGVLRTLSKDEDDGYENATNQ